MSKGQDSKKATKKKPEKTMKEKRKEKKEKKANKTQVNYLWYQLTCVVNQSN